MQLQFFNHPEGYIEPTVVAGTRTEKSVKGFDTGTGTTTYSDYKYVFQFKDHLGNVRLSYSDGNLDGTISQDEIIEESNYYPFGLKQKGYNYVQQGGNDLAQNWKFNGMEQNQELGLEWYDFGARNYDAALGRWMNIDPLAETSRRFSPYTYALNNPIYFIDPDGMQADVSAAAGSSSGGGGSIGQAMMGFGGINEDMIANSAFGAGSVNTKDVSGLGKGAEKTGTEGNNNNNGSNPTDYKKYFKDAQKFGKNGNFDIWPSPGAYRGQFRHILGPDAIALSIDIDLAGPTGGATVSPIGILMILRGKEKFKIQYIYDVAVAAGFDISVAGKFTALYFNGDVDKIKPDTFFGARVEIEVAVTALGIDFGFASSYSPKGNNFIKNAVYGESRSIGVGIPVPFSISGNVNVGYTGSSADYVKNLMKLLK